jgi:23S rRNA A2030 N6-methylase RlmJ
MPTQTSISTALTDIPEVLRPYITSPGGILPTAQTILSKDYATTYGDPLKAAGLAGSQRVAGLSPMQQQIGTELGGMATPGQFGAGTTAAQSGLGTLAGMTDPTKTAQYMSPYVQNVIDTNKAEAMRDAQKQLVGANLASSRQGTYGGARNALMQSEADRNLQTKLGSIQSTGMQNAFDAAQKAQIAQAAGYTGLGQTLGQLGTAQQATDIDRIKTQGAYGDLQKATQQQQLDAQYQDLMAKLNYPVTSLETMNNLVRGVPLTQTGQSTTTSTPPPSFASQLAGMGLTGLSLYNMFGTPR